MSAADIRPARGIRTINNGSFPSQFHICEGKLPLLSFQKPKPDRPQAGGMHHSGITIVSCAASLAACASAATTVCAAVSAAAFSADAWNV